MKTILILLELYRRCRQIEDISPEDEQAKEERLSNTKHVAPALFISVLHRQIEPMSSEVCLTGLSYMELLRILELL